MATEMIDLRSVITLGSFITFIGIVWWAYSARRKGAFDDAAQLPFMDGDEMEKHHG